MFRDVVCGVSLTSVPVDYLQYLWMAYGVIVAGFYFTKTKHTNDSFFTQLLTWLLFALGSHAVTGCASPLLRSLTSLGSQPALTVFNFLPPNDRMIVLKLTVTVTFFPYALYVWYDDTDYKKREAREAAKEKKRKLKEELLDEKVKEARRLRKQQMRQYVAAESADDASATETK